MEVVDLANELSVRIYEHHRQAVRGRTQVSIRGRIAFILLILNELSTFIPQTL